MESKRENHSPWALGNGSTFPQGWCERAAGSRCSSVLIPAAAGLHRAAGAPVPDGERWHVFKVRKRSFQQLERHAKINPRFLAGPFPSACLGPGETDPGEGLSWQEQPGKFSLHG